MVQLTPTSPMRCTEAFLSVRRLGKSSPVQNDKGGVSVWAVDFGARVTTQSMVELNPEAEGIQDWEFEQSRALVSLDTTKVLQGHRVQGGSSRSP